MTITIDFSSWHLPVIITVVSILATVITAAIDEKFGMLICLVSGCFTAGAWVVFILSFL